MCSLTTFTDFDKLAKEQRHDSFIVRKRQLFPVLANLLGPEPMGAGSCFVRVFSIMVRIRGHLGISGGL